MKIAILQSHFKKRGGLEKYTARLANAFAQNGCEVFLLTTDSLTFPFQLDPLVHPIFVAKPKKMTLLHLINFDKGCKKWLANNPVDIVFGMDRNTFQTHYRAGNGVHRAFLKRRLNTESFFKRISLLINPLHKILLNIEKKAFEEPRLQILFTNSHLVKEEILEYYSIDSKKIEVVHNGVEWDELKLSFEESFSKKIEVSKKFKLNPLAYQFLFIGNGYERKGLKELLHALHHFSKKHPSKQFELSVIGKEKNINKFKQLTKIYGLEKQVHFFGTQKDPIPFYQVADCLVIPSLYDPFANVTLEALAMGVFVISSRDNGGYEILTPETGISIKNIFNPQETIEAIQLAFEKPKTIESANIIRELTKTLDFSIQLDKIVRACLKKIDLHSF